MIKLQKIQIAKAQFAFTYFLLFILCIQVLPEIICSFQMLVRKGGLTQETVLVIRIISYIISFPFLYLALSSILNKRKERQFCSISVFIRAMFWFVAWAVSFIAMLDLMFEKGTFFKDMVQNNTNLYYIVVITISVIEVFAGIYLLHFTGYILGMDSRQSGGFAAFIYFITHPLWILECIGFSAVFAALYKGIPYLFGKLPMELSFVSRMAYLFFFSIVAAAILYIFYLREESRIFHYSLKKQENFEENTEIEQDEAVKRQKNKKKFIKNSISFGLAAAVIIGFSVTAGLEYSKYTANEEIIADIEHQIINGEYYLLKGDLDQALVSYRQASARAVAWKAVLEEDEEVLNELAQEYSSDVQIIYLYLMTREDTVQLENFLRSDATGYIWYHNLLTRYQQLDMKNLSAKQKALQKEGLYVCIANGSYVDKNIHPETIKNKRKLIQKLKAYEEVDLYADMLEKVIEVGRGGILNQELVNWFLDTAEENEDVFICQYLAYVMGTSYLDDNATHYSRTVKAIKAYDRLFANESVTEDQIKAEKLNAASGCMKCQDYESAISYLEEAINLGVEDAADMLMMQCYVKLEQTEECYEFAKEVLKRNPNNLPALYYASTEALKQKELDESIKYAVILAEKAMEEMQDYDTEILLYQYAQFMVLEDNSQWTDYVYSQYKNITEEQWGTIEESPLLADYLHALYYAFEESDYEKAIEAVDNILKVNENYPQANYLKAVILYQNKEFEESVTYYKKSIFIINDSANAWFGLANAYDAMEEYELAYQCCEKVASLKPYMNHDSSWYGVSVHNDNLMRELKKYVENER